MFSTLFDAWMLWYRSVFFLTFINLLLTKRADTSTHVLHWTWDYMTVLVFAIDKIIKYWGVTVVWEKWTFSLSLAIDHKISHKLWQSSSVDFTQGDFEKANNFQCVMIKNTTCPLPPKRERKTLFILTHIPWRNVAENSLPQSKEIN